MAKQCKIYDVVHFLIKNIRLTDKFFTRAIEENLLHRNIVQSLRGQTQGASLVLLYVLVLGQGGLTSLVNVLEGCGQEGVWCWKDTTAIFEAWENEKQQILTMLLEYRQEIDYKETSQLKHEILYKDKKLQRLNCQLEESIQELQRKLDDRDKEHEEVKLENNELKKKHSQISENLQTNVSEKIDKYAQLLSLKERKIQQLEYEIQEVKLQLQISAEDLERERREVTKDKEQMHTNMREVKSKQEKYLLHLEEQLKQKEMAIQKIQCEKGEITTSTATCHCACHNNETKNKAQINIDSNDDSVPQEENFDENPPNRTVKFTWSKDNTSQENTSDEIVLQLNKMENEIEARTQQIRLLEKQNHVLDTQTKELQSIYIQYKNASQLQIDNLKAQQHHLQQSIDNLTAENEQLRTAVASPSPITSPRGSACISRPQSEPFRVSSAIRSPRQPSATKVGKLPTIQKGGISPRRSSMPSFLEALSQKSTSQGKDQLPNIEPRATSTSYPGKRCLSNGKLKGKPPTFLKNPNPNITTVCEEMTPQGGSINMQGATLLLPPEALESPTYIQCTENISNPAKIENVKRTGMYDFVKPGSSYNFRPNNLKLQKKVTLSSKKPSDNPNHTSLVVHQRSMKKGNVGGWEDITDKCLSKSYPEDRVNYSLVQLGEIQEFWMVLMEENRALRKRLLHMHNSESIACDFILFLPQLPPVSFIEVVCSDQSLEQKCLEIFRSRDKNMIKCGQEISNYELCNDDELVFMFDALLSIQGSFKLDIDKCRTKGQRFKLSLTSSSIPSSIKVARSKSDTFMPQRICTIIIDINGIEIEDPHRQILRQFRLKLIKDVDFKDLVHALRQDNTINERMQEEIEQEKTRMDRMAKFIDILSCRQEKGFLSFLAILQESYDWLATEMEQCLNLIKTELS